MAWTLTVALRAWQQQAIRQWQQLGMKGIAAVVTGGGKTVFAEACMVAFQSRFPNGRVVIIVPTEALADQWYVSLVEELGVSPEEIATYSGHGVPSKPLAVNIMILNTARRHAPELSSKYQVLLIVDECHRAASPENAKALRGTPAATLGLSATPDRQYDEGLDQVLIPHLGPIIHRLTYHDALKSEIITRFRLINVKVDLLLHEQQEYDSLTRKIIRNSKSIDSNEDYVKRLLQQRATVSANAAMRIPVALKTIEQHKNEKTILFHERVDAANRMVSTLNQRGFHAVAYHTGMSAGLRRDNLRWFRRGLFDVLATCRALDEGFNVPEASVAVIASGTASFRQRVQRLGRVLRPAQGKELATIYTIYATEVEEKRLVDEAQEYADIATISWLRSSMRRHGTNST